MKKLSGSVMLCFFTAISFAQINLPTDYLSKEFHAGRREALRQLMPANSVTLIFSYPERTFSNDVSYVFHQNPDLYYFSGYKEPDAVLLVFKEMQGGSDSAYNELFFVRKRDPNREQWTGRRLGTEGAKKLLGFKYVYEGAAFKKFPIDLTKFSTIIYDRIPKDIQIKSSAADLAGLLTTFKEKANLKEVNEELHDAHQNIARYLNIRTLPRWVTYLKETSANNESFKNDPYVQQILANPDSSTLVDIKTKLKQQKTSTDIYTDLTNSLRQIKTPEELALIRKAVMISALGHNEVIRAVTPSMGEQEAEGIHRYMHKKYGAEEEGYPPIVGVGANGCILHYQENNSTKMENQLLLMDVACEYHGYSADVTRTVPANGKFSPEQKAIYQLVYDAQEAAFKLCVDGKTFGDVEKKAQDVLADGLVKLGIITDQKEVRTYYPHGCSHFLGLDVHDKGDYDVLKENMVITVEPGIYIPEGSKCDQKWWNIGVRIEDDVRIGKQECEIMSTLSPRKWEDVEKMAAEKSKFNEMPLKQL